MGVKKSGRRVRARQVEGLSNISTFGGGARISRAALLAGASLVALGALAAPDRALAACSGKNQTISSPSTPGPFSARAAILQSTPARASPGARQASTPRIAGSARSATAAAIGGAAGSFGRRGRHWGAKPTRARPSTADQRERRDDQRRQPAAADGMRGGAGGAGVSNAGTITTLTNSGDDQRRKRRRRLQRQAARAARACRTPARSRR